MKTQKMNEIFNKLDNSPLPSYTGVRAYNNDHYLKECYSEEKEKEVKQWEKQQLSCERQ